MFCKNVLISVLLKASSSKANIDDCMKLVTSLPSDFYQNVIYAIREKEKTVTSSASPGNGHVCVMQENLGFQK